MGASPENTNTPLSPMDPGRTGPKAKASVPVAAAPPTNRSQLQGEGKEDPFKKLAETAVADRPTISPTEPFVVKAGDTVFNIALRLSKEGPLAAKEPKELAAQLTRFLGGTNLKLDSSIDIPGFIERVTGRHVVKPQETLFSILRNYRDHLPASDPLLKTPVRDLVAVENTQRRADLKLKANQPLALIQPGQEIDLKRIFDLRAVQAVEKRIAEEGSHHQLPPPQSKGSRTHKSPLPSKPPSNGRLVSIPEELLEEDLKVFPVTEAVLDRFSVGTLADRARARSVPAERGLAHIMCESSGNPEAYNDGAYGLFQLRRITIKERIGREDGDRYDMRRLYNQRENMDHGLAYLRQLYDRFGTWDDASIAFRIGPTKWEAIKQAYPGRPESDPNSYSYVRAIKSYEDQFRKGARLLARNQ